MISSIISLKYLTGICGAGKTYAIAAWANKQAHRGQKVLLVQPTTKLVHETINTTFPAMHVTARVTGITSKTHPWKVQETIDKHLKEADDQGEILVVTHSAFFGLKFFFNPHRWIVIVDEIPAVERAFSLSIPDTHSLLTKHIEVSDRSHSEYWQITAKNEAKVREIAKNKHGDEVYEHFRQFADTVLSRHWVTYVNAQNYERLTKETDVDGVARQLVGSAFMMPTVFESFKLVVIAGACFTESLLYILWSNLANPNVKVDFKDWGHKFQLRQTQHQNGALLDIYYGVDCPWSKNVRSKAVTLADGSQSTVLEAITRKAREMVGSKEIAIFANADVTDQLFENAERLPNISHGLNTYQTIDHAFLVSALNPPPSHFTFLKRFFDIDSDVVQTAMFRQSLYQAANRTSIRDPNNTNRKMWFVPDSGTAYWLAGMYPDCRVHDLKLFGHGQIISHGKAGRPRQHASQADKAKAYRKRKEYRDQVILERLIRTDIVNDMSLNIDRDMPLALEVIEGMTEAPNLLLSKMDPKTFQGTFFKNNIATAGDAFAGSFDDLARLYRELAEVEREDKDTLPALSPSLYVANGSDTKRGYANIVFARNIILDYDGGDLTPDQFDAIIPGWRKIIHSSWSSTLEKPKWRVLIPTDHVLDIENYKVITGYIITELNRAGYYCQKEIDAKPSIRGLKEFRGIHGFDPTKLNPACLLYVPAKRPDGFFVDIPGEPIRVYDLLKQIDPPYQEPPNPIELQLPPVHEPLPEGLTASMRAMAEKLRAEQEGSYASRKEQKIKEATEKWSEHDMDGRRDEGIWLLCIRLRNAGCDRQEAIQVADDVIRSSWSKDKRRDRDKAKRALRKLI